MGDEGLKWVTMGQETNSSTTESSGDLNPVLQRTDLLRLKRAMMEQETNSFTTESSNNEEDYLNPPLELKRPWSDLPFELLEQIDDRLAIIELLSFRGTCREWRRVASFKASAHHHHQTESSTTTTTNQVEQPWFLLYGKNEYPNCSLYDSSSEKLYEKINIPELGEGVSCIASKGGWLLLYRDSNRSMFFFCPFSRAKIDLPKLPNVDDGPISRRTAAFSSPPTSLDCILCVGTNTSYNPQFLGGYNKFVLHVLRRGANEWDEHEFRHLPHRMNISRCAMFSKGTIYFVHSFTTGVAFSLEEKQWFNIPTTQEFLPRVRPEMDDYFSNGDKGKLGLKDIDSLSICGTQIGSDDNDDDDLFTYIYNKEIKGTCTRSVDDVEGVMKLHHSRAEGVVELLCNEVEMIVEFFRGRPPLLPKPKNKCGVPIQPIGKKHKGVWIQPRFFLLPANYSW
ncbi:F-box domain [Macleaya cordata]|uniref:F-box domain n=1 Tax=Macleaya cordata TaxID=56857 RepID=A0A200QSR5_MACCD|nr:F-box domain [Macleaya cordata]